MLVEGFLDARRHLRPMEAFPPFGPNCVSMSLPHIELLRGNIFPDSHKCAIMSQEAAAFEKPHH
jgi:hypothetical protein